MTPYLRTLFKLTRKVRPMRTMFYMSDYSNVLNQRKQKYMQAIFQKKAEDDTYKKVLAGLGALGLGIAALVGGRRLFTDPDKVARGIAIAGGLMGLGAITQSVVSSVLAKRKAIEIAKELKKSDPVIAQMNEDELTEYVDYLMNVAPNVLSHPAALKTVLRQVATYGGIDPQTIKLFLEMEENAGRDLKKHLAAGNILMTLGGTLLK